MYITRTPAVQKEIHLNHQPPSVRMLPSSLFCKAYRGLVISIPLPLLLQLSICETLPPRLVCHLAILEELLLTLTEDVRPGIVGLVVLSNDPADPVVGLMLILDCALGDCLPPRPL